MTVLLFTLLVGLGSLVAGMLGAMTGLGGGVVIVPLLAIAFHVDLRYAIGASLVSVIATSSGAAAAYVREGYSNIRIGMLLEIATTLGAIGGAMLALLMSARRHCRRLWSGAVDFGGDVGPAASAGGPPAQSDWLARRLRLASSYPTPDGTREYHVVHVPLGLGLMSLAGVLSGMLGIGSGAFKVLAMDQAMKLPFKVWTTTSNFMIGVTAAASAGVYLSRGYIDPGYALPVVLGVLAGSVLGTRILVVAQVRVLRLVFALVVLALAVEMIYKGIYGGL